MMDTSKRRLNLALSMDNPLQKQAWEILCATEPGTRTTMICHALCEYQRQQSVMENIRKILQQELRNITLQSMPKLSVNTEKAEENTAVLDFIQRLQQE